MTNRLRDKARQSGLSAPSEHHILVLTRAAIAVRQAGSKSGEIT